MNTRSIGRIMQKVGGMLGGRGSRRRTSGRTGTGRRSGGGGIGSMLRRFFR